MNALRCPVLHPRGWLASLLTILAGAAAIAAPPPPSPETASEIERALSVPGGAQPGLRLRGGPGSGGSGVGKLRGPAGIVDDPAASDAAPISAPAAPVSRSVDTLDYPVLVRERPKIAALIHFDHNSARIRGDAYKLLNEYAKALKSEALAGAVLVIAGHTDAVGSDQRNLQLSRQRAQAVRDYLVERGVAPDRLIAKGYGEAYPVASNDTEADRELNRRSEFIRVDGPATGDP